MCKYCENDGVWFWNEFLVDEICDNGILIRISLNIRDKKLEAQIGNMMTNNDNDWFLFSKKINYCPMCGRRLGE